MLNIRIRVNTDAAMKLVREQLPNAVPFVKAAMLTRLAVLSKAAVQKQMPVAFDRPTPFTQRGVFVKSATRAQPLAEVFFPDSAEQGGKAVREYLQPGVKGSPKRRQKRTEFLLSRTGWLPPGWVTTPGSSTDKLGMIDGYGNLKGRIYAQIINVLQIKRAESKTARGVSAKSQARAKKMGVQSEWFAVQPGKNALAKGGGWLPPGVYRRGNGKGKDGGTLHQVLKFVQKAAYRPLLDVEGTVRQAVLDGQQQAFSEAIKSVAARFTAKVKA